MLTPERLAEIRAKQNRQQPYSNDGGREAEADVVDLLAHIDALTADNHALVNRVDKLFVALTQEQKAHWQARDEIADWNANAVGAGRRR